jgi:hypothetical protein
MHCRSRQSVHTVQVRHSMSWKSCLICEHNYCDEHRDVYCTVNMDIEKMRLAVNRPLGVTLAAVMLYVHGENAGNEWKMQHKTRVGHHRTSVDNPYTSCRQPFVSPLESCQIGFLQETLDTKVTQKRPIVSPLESVKLGTLCNHTSQRDKEVFRKKQWVLELKKLLQMHP